MNKLIMIGVTLVAFLAVPLRAASAHSGSEFCLKHCTAVQMGVDIKTLGKSIEGLKTAASATKLVTANDARKQIAQYEADIASLKTQKAALESDLVQMEGK